MVLFHFSIPIGPDGPSLLFIFGRLGGDAVGLRDGDVPQRIAFFAF
jgi:hypothetical protein